MLPRFSEHGYLPPGIHPCTVAELVDRFGSGSPEREVETQELLGFIQVLVAADDDDLEAWAMRDFGTDREQRPKGVVEVLL